MDTMFEIKYLGIIFLGKTKEDLYSNIIKYCNNKNITPSISKGYVLDNAKVGSMGNRDDKNLPNPVGTLKFKDVVSGAAALVKCVIGQCVDQKEINRRAMICTNCKELKTVSNCRSCGFGGTLQNFLNKIKKTIFKKGFD